MSRTLKLALMATSAFLLAGQAYAASCPGLGTPNPPGDTNCPPPVGHEILNLDGTAIPHTYTPFAVDFVATSASTNLSFAFREDPAFLLLDNVSVTTGGGSNLVLNGDFELGIVGDNAPVDWTYLNSFGASFAGVVAAGCGNPGNCYDDGAVQAYDGITQAIPTIVGDTYNVTFDLNDNGPLTTFSTLSTNGVTVGTGGNGANLVVYAGAIPVRAPEPASLALLGSALAGLGIVRRRRRSSR